MDTLERIRVVLASPSDLAEERQMVQKLVEEINTISTRKGVYIDLRMWEKTIPGMSINGPQGVVDLDLEIPKADIFICMYGKKVGTIIPSEGVAGTEHELNTALDSFMKHRKPDIKAYFKSASEDEPETSDSAYIKGIAKRLQPMGLYNSFESADSLRSKISQLLNAAVLDKTIEHSIVEPNTPTHVEVSTIKELVPHLGPGNRIILEKGFYDILDFSEKTEYLSKCKVFDGEEAHLVGINNLTLIGDSAAILARPRYATVLTLSRCENIKISGISFGHTPHSGSCVGAVVKLADCKNIQFDSCEFFGCGTFGLSLINCENIVINGSKIFECTHGAIDIAVSDLVFSNSTIFECSNLWYSLITLRGGTLNLDNVSIFDNSTAGSIISFFDLTEQESEQYYGVKGEHPAWVIARGVCAYNNTYSSVSNKQIRSGIFLADNIERN